MNPHTKWSFRWENHWTQWGNFMNFPAAPSPIRGSPATAGCMPLCKIHPHGCMTSPRQMVDFCCNLQGPCNNGKKWCSIKQVGNQALHLGTRDDTCKHCKLKHWTCRFRGIRHNTENCLSKNHNRHPSRRMTARPTDRAGSCDDPNSPTASPSQNKVWNIGKMMGKVYERFWNPPARSSTSWISCVFWSFQLWPSSFASQPDGFGIEQEVPQPCPGFTGPKIPHAFP